MVSFNWKKITIIAADIALAVYLVLAVTSFNKPDELVAACSEVKIDIEHDATDGFLNNEQIMNYLKANKLNPVGQAMNKVDARQIEEMLERSPFVEKAECYKTLDGKVCIQVKQKTPVFRVQADNGDDYYLDNHGGMLTYVQYPSNLIVATGHISRQYAKSVLTAIGNKLIEDKFWQNQIEQLNVLQDGTVEIVPRVGDHIVYLGKPDKIEAKLDRLQKFYIYGLSQAGWNRYSYINLEFDNQIICKKVKK